ncbi:MAG: S8 family peptidase, partial [Patescibacteria group bacterium]
MRHKLFFIIFIIIFLFGNFVVSVNAFVPNDPDYSKQWYLPAIKADKAWDITTGSSDVIVAVIDAGVDIDHPDLVDNIWINSNEISGNGIDDDKNGYIDDVYGWDFVENSNNPRPKFKSDFTKAAINHGTVISGIIAAKGNNNQGVAGINFQAKIMSLRVLNEQGKGYDNSIVKAIDYAIKNGARILNLSFEGKEKNEKTLEVIERAWKAGLIIVAAAGNESLKNQENDLDKTFKYPICYDGQENRVIGVAAIDDKNQKTNFSGFGEKCVDIVTPGIVIWGTQDYNQDKADFKEYYGGYYNGTSFSVPQVVASVALIWSQFPNLTNVEVRDLILNGADNIDDQNPDYKNKLGTGKLNIYQSLILAQNLKKDLSGKKIVATTYKNNRVYLKIFKFDSDLNYQQIIYNQHFQGGVNIATENVNNSEENEIITGQKIGEPLVKIFDSNGGLKNQFMAYNIEYSGGINVAAGDIDGDGKDEIITS